MYTNKNISRIHFFLTRYVTTIVNCEYNIAIISINNAIIKAT